MRDNYSAAQTSANLMVCLRKQPKKNILQSMTNEDKGTNDID
jgi:hypothetical protein